MSTQAQQQASRDNGAKSHGPMSDEGKKIAAQNAVKHGLASTDPNPDTLLLFHENPAELALMRADYYRRYAPTDTVECDLVDRIIAAQWRLRRARQMETLTLESERFTEDPDTGETIDLGFAHAFKQNFQAWKTIQRYESRQSREIARCLKELRLLQSEESDPSLSEADAFEASLLSYVMGPLPGEPGHPNQRTTPPQENNQTNPSLPIFHPDHIKKYFPSPFPNPKP